MKNPDPGKLRDLRNLMIEVGFDHVKAFRNEDANTALGIAEKLDKLTASIEYEDAGGLNEGY